VWDYIKNSGNFKDVDNLTLEWISAIPGKRESRRFEGDYILRQQDVIEQKPFDDAIAHGGWAIDLHPAKGVYSSYHGCTQYHSKGVYTIPYRCVYSRNISNLFMGGRLISVSHVAFGSTRVISTGTLCAQAAALAAVLCRKYDITPRDVHKKGYIGELQQMLIRTGQYLPGVRVGFPDDLASAAKITVSGTLALSVLPGNGEWKTLKQDMAMLLPIPKGKMPQFTFNVKTTQPTILTTAFHVSQKPDNFTPEVCLSVKEYALVSGTNIVDVNFGLTQQENRYGFIILQKNEQVSVELSEVRMTGILSLFHRGDQQQNEKFGVEKVPFYTPERRPGGKNPALKIKPALNVFGTEQLRKTVFRPTADAPNAWIAPLEQDTAVLKYEWKQPQSIRTIILWFDTDFDHSMESCLMGHPENVMPYCVQQYQIVNDRGKIIYETSDNHHCRNEIRLENPVQTASLTVQLHRAHDNIPVSLFGIQIFG
jgi:hypothetical protein